MPTHGLRRAPLSDTNWGLMTFAALVPVAPFAQAVRVAGFFAFTTHSDG